MPKRNQTTYVATLSGLKTHAFGIDQTLPWITEVEIYQARVSPELWRARPMMQHAQHKWEALSAEALMQIITLDFETFVKPWQGKQPDGRFFKPKSAPLTTPDEVTRAS